MLMKKKTRFVILGLLRDEDLTGYELKNLIDLRMSYFWKESYGQLYPELNALVQEGLLLSYPVVPSDKRERIKYSITVQGRDAFNRWMSEDYEKDTVRSEALLKFFLADRENEVDLIKHLKKFYNQNHTLLEIYEKFHACIQQDSTHQNHDYILQMLDLGRKQQQLYCDWSSEYLNKLMQREKDDE